MVEKALRSLTCSHRAQQRAIWTVEIDEAHWSGDRARVHRLIRLLAGRRAGVKRRVFFHIQQSRPSATDLVEYAEAPAVSSGLSGRHFTDLDLKDLAAVQAEPLKPVDENDVRAAEEDMKGMLFAMKRGRTHMERELQEFPIGLVAE
jgi:hypothetical protein